MRSYVKKLHDFFLGGGNVNGRWKTVESLVAEIIEMRRTEEPHAAAHETTGRKSEYLEFTLRVLSPKRLLFSYDISVNFSDGDLRLLR